MVLATRSDFLRDRDRQLERGGGLKTRNPRLAPRGGAFDKRNELLLQRFFPLDRNFVARDFSRLEPIDFAALLFVVEREIGVLLKYADLAHPLRADPARSHVGYATVLETNPRVGNVFSLAQNRNTNRVDVLHRRAHQM